MTKPEQWIRFFYLTEEDHPIFVLAKRRPTELTIPKRGSWVVREFDGMKWILPPFPEITWGTLKRLKYIGRDHP